MKSIVVGTAGHIDHGKSALVLALTGTDPDRLKEEKARGITIDLGFAHMVVDDLNVAFVDVPGHERFVKNMLAGAAGIDLVILVVAADESVMPQTREHFDICRLLRVPAGIVALTTGFSYVIASRAGVTDLSFGQGKTPDLHDGTAVVQVDQRGIALIDREVRQPVVGHFLRERVVHLQHAGNAAVAQVELGVVGAALHRHHRLAIGRRQRRRDGLGDRAANRLGESRAGQQRACSKRRDEPAPVDDQRGAQGKHILAH